MKFAITESQKQEILDYFAKAPKGLPSPIKEIDRNTRLSIIKGGSSRIAHKKVVEKSRVSFAFAFGDEIPTIPNTYHGNPSLMSEFL